MCKRYILPLQIESSVCMCVCFEGCLKAQASSLFIPSLPTEKIEVIDKLCFGNIAKIVLEYEEAFWENDVGSISLIYEDDTPASVSTNKMQWLKSMQSFSVLRPKERLMLYQMTVKFSVILNMLHLLFYICMYRCCMRNLDIYNYS